MNKTTNLILIFAVAGVAIYYFFFRNPPGASGAVNTPGNGFALTTPAQAAGAIAGNPKGFNYSAFLAAQLKKSNASPALQSAGGSAIKLGDAPGLFPAIGSALTSAYKGVVGWLSSEPQSDSVAAQGVQDAAWANYDAPELDVPATPEFSATAPVDGSGTDSAGGLYFTNEVKANPSPAVAASRAKPLRNKYALAAIARRN
jgi:hypothetical protein